MVAVWIGKDEPLAQSKKLPKMVVATNLRVDRKTEVGNSWNTQGVKSNPHNAGMLRCVECSADVGLTFALQYVYASEETMRVSQDSLASLGLFAGVVDGCWCG